MLEYFITILKCTFKVLPLNPLVYIFRHKPVLTILEFAVYYFYGSYFYEIPTKKTIDKDDNIYLDINEFYELEK